MPISDEAMMQELRAFISRTNHLRSSPDEEAIWAPVIAREALQLAARLCGASVLKEAYGPMPDVEDRSAMLSAASERLATVFHFFATVEQVGSGSSIMDVAAEAANIAGGDRPTLFAMIAPEHGKRANTFSLAIWRMRALEWEAYLSGLGIKAERRREMVAAAFGVTPDAMDKWRRRDLPKSLGTDVIDLKVRIAARMGAQDLWLTDRGQDDSQLRSDGEAYRRAQGFG